MTSTSDDELRDRLKQHQEMVPGERKFGVNQVIGFLGVNWHVVRKGLCV